MEAKEKYNIVRSSFMNHLGFLIVKLGYQIQIQEDDYTQPPYKQSIKIKLFKESINRTIFFMYQPHNGEEYAVFSITGEPLYSTIYINSYIKFHKERFPNIWNILGMKNSPGNTFEQKVENYFDLIEKILQNNLKGVIEGKEWISLPMDWGAIGK